MASFVRKEKVNDNPQINFNHSKEIAYWAKKFNVSTDIFQQIFEDNNYSITKTLAFCNARR